MDEFTVRLAPNVGNKRYNVFKLHKDDNVTWTEAKMRRENDNQPWQIKLGNGRSARRFKAFKEGGVGDNASYFVFYKPKDKSNVYEVCPIEEWYSVSATQRYKTLTAEEAELKFEQRHKTLNLFSVMHLKKNGEAGEDGPSGSDRSGFKVSELDDWNSSAEDDDGNEDLDGESDQKKKRRIKKEKDDPDDAPDEAKEESDEGDFEQREVDYMSSSSSDSEENDEEKDETDVKGIAEEEALRDLLSTDDEDDAEGEKQGDTKGGVEVKKDPVIEGSDESSDSDDYDVDDDKLDSMIAKKDIPAQLSTLKQEPDIKSEPSMSGTGSGSKQQSNVNKRKAAPELSTIQTQPVKRPCTVESTSSALSGQEKMVEDLLKKYLSRKPMTIKTLLKEMKSKLRRMEGATPEMDNNLVNTIAIVIKRLHIEKQKVNDQTYLFLKS